MKINNRILTTIASTAIVLTLSISLAACGHTDAPELDATNPSVSESTIPMEESKPTPETDPTEEIGAENDGEFIEDQEASEPTIDAEGGEVDETEPSEPKEEHTHKYSQKVTKPTCTAGGYTTNTCECGDSFISDKTSKIKHSYAAKVTQPTCRSGGYTTYTCSCGDSYVGDKTSKIDHRYVPTVVQPTCTSEGYTSYKCSGCGDTYIGNKTSEIDHLYKFTVIAPTCTEEGYTIYECSVCGDKYTGNKVPEAPHNYEEIVTSPTCTSEGYTTYTCECGDSYVGDKTNKSPHVYSHVVTVPTCTAEGYTTHTCECGDTYTDTVTQKAPHTFTEYTSDENATCVANGTKTANCDNCDAQDTVEDFESSLGHECGEWKDSGDDLEHFRTCIREGCQYVESAQHHYDNVVVTPPTCTTEGCTTNICACCKTQITNKTEKIPHNYIDVVTDPTCTNKGYTTHTCAVCENSYVDNYVNVIAHTPGESVKENIINATCENDGKLDEVVYCAVCKAEIERTERVLNAPGHNYGEWYSFTKPNCDNDGEDRRDCANCDYFETRVVNKLNHNYSVVIKHPTCQEGGCSTYTCVNCGHSYVGDETGKIEHKYACVVTNPTCTEKGYTTYTCSMCGDNYIGDYVDTVPHTYESVVTAPTCISEGYTTHTCACGDTYTDSITSKIAHSFTEYKSDENATCEKDGTKTAKCNVCEEIDTVEDVDSKLGHVYSGWQKTANDNHMRECTREGCDFTETEPHVFEIVVTAPTCTKTGYTTHTCKCGHSYIDNETAIVPHDYEKAITEPTCAAKGYSTYTCKMCGDSYVDDETDTIPHKYVEEIVAPTCTEKGYTIFKCECGDSYTGNETETIPHTYEETVVDPTCTTEGYTIYTCKCGDTHTGKNTSKLPHNYTSEVTEPTCAAEGYTTYTCECGDTYTADITSKLDHIYAATVVAPTCTSGGYTLYTCECGDSYTGDKLDKLAHVYEPKVVSATCIEDGYTIYTCACGDSYTGDIVETLGHNWGVWITIEESTVLKEGLAERSCIACGETETKVLDRIPIFHEHKYAAIVTDPTCTANGYTTYTCECGDSYVDNMTPKLDHNHESVVTDPTCLAGGYTTYKCSMCGDTYVSDYTDKLPHDYINETLHPTCTVGGYTTHTCISCGYNYTDNEKGALGHNYGQWSIIRSPTAKSEGLMERTCSRCDSVESNPIDKLNIDPNIVAYYKVVDGVLMDLITETVVTNTTIDGEYFYGGTIKLPKNYSNWTYQMIVDYNEKSSAGIIKMIKFNSNSGKYEECDNVFKLGELTAIYNRSNVRIPWVKDSWNSGYNVRIPVQLYAHVSTDYEILPIGDTFWSFSMDSDNGTLISRINGGSATTTMSTYVNEDGDTKFVSKILPATLNLTTDHAVKEIVVFDRAQTAEEQIAAYEKTGITAPNSGINEVVDGLTDMGSSLYFEKDKDGNITIHESEKKPGTYTVYGENGLATSYTITNYVHPDLGIDNSIYESVHIVNEPETIDVGKQYPLVAYPYPFNIIGEDGKSDKFDVTWSTSDSSVVAVIDGLLIAKKAGTVTITATLTGTDMKDSVTIVVANPAVVADKPWNVPSDYVSANGDSFSDTDYAMTTRAIYAAIDEAHANGYNHIVFPKQNFYAQPITNADGTAKWYYVPSNMTIEFPEGSVFYMMDNEVSRGPGNLIEIHYFHFGVPNNDYTNVCENSHLIIDTYYGERYQNTTHKETEYLEENRFVNFGRRSINCSAEVRNAYYVAGYFIVADGTSNTNKKTGVMNRNDFASGWLNDNGEIEENTNWISTVNFITVPDYGNTGYFISAHGQDSYAGKYWNGCSARTYDILWFDENQELMLIERFNGRGDYYDIPDGAAYFKVSLQQPALPTDDTTDASPYIAMHSDGASKMCEIKNTRVWNSACGVFSVVGQTDGLWVHDCFTNRDGMKPYNERTGDFENGWTQMRHSVVSNNFFKGYFGNHGYNTFIHTNYMTNYSGFSGEAELLRYINNTTDYVELSEKCQAHIFYNTLYTTRVDYLGTSIGHTHTANNKTGQWVRSY